MMLLLLGCLVPDSRLEQLLDADRDGFTVGEDCDDQNADIGACGEPIDIEEIATAFGNPPGCIGESIAVGRAADGLVYLAAGSDTEPGSVQVYQLDTLQQTAEITDPHPRFGASVHFVGDDDLRPLQLAVSRPSPAGPTSVSFFGVLDLMCGSCTSDEANFDLSPDEEDVTEVGWTVQLGGASRIFSARRSDGNANLLFRSSEPPEVERSFEFEATDADGRFGFLQVLNGSWVGSPTDDALFFFENGQLLTTTVTGPPVGFGSTLFSLDDRLVVGGSEIHVFSSIPSGSQTSDALSPLRLIGPPLDAMQTGDFLDSPGQELAVVSDSARLLWIVEDLPTDGLLDLRTLPSYRIPGEGSDCGGMQLAALPSDPRDVLVLSDPSASRFWRLELPGTP